MDAAAIHSLATGESAARSSRDGMRVVSVRVIKIVGRVNDVHVADECIPNIDPLPEPVAAAEPWVERFAKT